MMAEKRQAFDIFAAVFSQKPNVCENRLTILESIRNADTGEMKFTELLRNVQSFSEGANYNSQRLNYDLQVLKERTLIDQTSEGNYTITKYGSYVLDVYKRIEHELSENETREKPGFVGGVTGTISTDEFDHRRLGDELCKLPFFERTPSFEENKTRLEFKDVDEDFASEIEISDDGSFAAQVIIYENIPGIQESFIEDLEKTTKWHKMAEGFVRVVYYYIDRSASRLWKNARVKIALGPDSYPINMYRGRSKA